jgi:hypothetical protein
MVSFRHPRRMLFGIIPDSILTSLWPVWLSRDGKHRCIPCATGWLSYSHAKEHEDRKAHISAARVLNGEQTAAHPQLPSTSRTHAHPCPPAPSLSDSLSTSYAVLVGPALPEDPSDAIYDDFDGALAPDLEPPADDQEPLEDAQAQYEGLDQPEPSYASGLAARATPQSTPVNLSSATGVPRPEIRASRGSEQGPSRFERYIWVARAHLCSDPFEDESAVDDPVGWFPYQRVQVRRIVSTTDTSLTSM